MHLLKMKHRTNYQRYLQTDKHKQSKNSNSTGFTLFETIAVMALFLLVVMLIGSVFLLAQRTYTSGNSHNELIQNARVCFDRLSRELRQASDLVTDLSATSSKIFFQDGHNDDSYTYVYYYLDGSNLMRDHVAYYFGVWPVTEDQYVRHNAIDGFGTSAASSTLSSKIIGEYFSDINFTNNSGLVTISANLDKARTTVNVNTKAYIRNW